MTDYPTILSAREVRFEILFALQQVEKSTINLWAGKDRLKRIAARERVLDIICARFDRLQVSGPPPIKPMSEIPR